MLDVKRLRILREVAARRSFSAAAEALSFTQSAVSQHIAALEREAGTQLVERAPRGVRLTEAGSALVGHTDAILARLEDAEQELAAIAGLDGGKLRLGSFPTAGSTLVPRAVAVFHARHPNVELGLVEGEPEVLLPRLRAGELDLILSYDWESVPTTVAAEVERVALLEEPMQLVLPRGHRLADQRVVALEELAEEKWISGTGPGSCNELLVRAAGEAGFEPDVAFETDDCLTCQAFVAAGVGVCMLPRLGLSPAHPEVEIRSLGPAAPVRRVWAARLAEGYRSPAGEAMLQILEDVGHEFHGTMLPLLDDTPAKVRPAA